MKYESQIDGAFSRLGFAPRPGQKEAVNQILTAFLDENIINLVMSASTGAGKSLIGAVTAEALTEAKGQSNYAFKSSISLTGTNLLSRQYASTFSGISSFLILKGAGNYDCGALSTDAETQNAEACAFYTMLKNQSDFFDTIRSHCDSCEFLQNKRKRNEVRHLTTNYAYYFIDKLYAKQLDTRDLIIWDEAHLLNDLFSDHNSIYFSEKRLTSMKEEIAETVGITDVETSKTLNSIIKACAKQKINDDNYTTYLHALQDIYVYAKNEGKKLSNNALRSNQMSKYSKFARFSKKYEGLACKIDDFFKHDYEHVFEYKEEDKSVSVKPIFVGKMFNALRGADHNLFMSATVSLEFMITTLALDPAVTKFIKLPPTFPKENKKIIFFDPLPLSYKTLQDKKVVESLRKNVSKVVKKHVEQGERGIILTPSFKLQSEIVAELQSTDCKYKLFDQRQGEKLENVLAAFKAYKDGPAVLVSPALYEGVDLPGELSRFQVIVKAPFPSLGDKRMQHILKFHPTIYNSITTMKLIQGAGRSVRSPEDFATTYILDGNGQRLFTSSSNVWQDEFLTSFTKFI